MIRRFTRLLVPIAALFVALPAAAASAPSGGAAARGKYLVNIMSCNDCHTPFKMGPAGPEPDMTRMLSGHPAGMTLPPPPAPVGPWIWSGSGTNTAFAGPWGVTYSANLTPDQNTGLGIWTEDMFVKAMRTGKHMGTSRPIQPPMPWPWVGKATDADLKAIFAYLKSVPAISNRVPDWVEPKAADAKSPAAARPEKAGKK
ncbi:MAG: diheme cytochrome c-553 [Acidobacteria bacterium]|nr:diheme cytochrome c-553 [Acidobacteriota bacterium]